MDLNVLKRFVWLLLFIPMAYGQSVFNCTSFASSGACQVNYGGTPGTGVFRINDAGSSSGELSAPTVTLLNTGVSHVGIALLYQYPVNVQAFTTNFKFVPNGQNVGLVFTNNTNSAGGSTTTQFAGGAGCEAGLIQAFVSPQINNTFGLVLDSYSPLTNGGSFSYSSAQVYQAIQSPCNPNDGGPSFWFTTKLSTSPVPLNSPATTQNSTTGDTYSATLVYDGSTLTLTMFDVTASGSCPGSSCFTQTWTNMSIPSLVAATTGYIGIIAAPGSATVGSLIISAYSYTVNTPTATPSFASYNANATTNPGTVTAATPTFSLAPGSYSGSQAVTIATTTSGGNICYETATGSAPSLLPQTDNQGGCAHGTSYTGPVSIGSSTTLYAIAGTNGGGNPSAVTAAAYTITMATSTASPGLPPTGSSTASALAGQSISPSVVFAKFINGVSICVNYTGSTPDVKANACIADAIAKSNGNTTGKADMTGLIGTTAAIINFGDTSGDTVDIQLNCTGALTAGFGTGTEYGFMYYTGAELHGCPVSGLTDRFAFTSNTSSDLYAVFGVTIVAANPYYHMSGFNVSNISGGHSTTSGFGMIMDGASANVVSSDASTMEFVEVDDSLDTTGSAATNGGAVLMRNGCCSSNWHHSSINAQGQGTPLTLQADANSYLQGITISEGSIVDPGAGRPLIACTDSRSTKDSYITFRSEYHETNSTSTTGNLVTSTCSSLIFDTPLVVSNIANNAMTFVNTATGIAVINPQFIPGTGSWTYPVTVLPSQSTYTQGTYRTYTAVPTWHMVQVPTTLTAQSASISATTLYTVPSVAGTYRFCANTELTRPSTTGSTLATVGVIYTSATDFASKSPSVVNYFGNATINTVALAGSGCTTFSASASSNIQYQTFGYLSDGATTMQYDLQMTLEVLE